METRDIPRSDSSSTPSAPPEARIAILLQGERYELWVPKLFGAFDLVCDSTAPGQEDQPVFNVLDAVRGLPPELRESLPTDDRQTIQSTFALVRETAQGIDAAHGRPWVREAKADLAESTSRILASEPALGESRWASLLAAERGLKAFIVTRGQRASHTHHLIELAMTAEAHGLVTLPRAWIESVQCAEGVLDGVDTGDLAEAVRAQECAFEIVRHAIVGIPRF
jgi:hypothetical protein